MYPVAAAPLCPYFQDFSDEFQQLVLEELFHPNQSPPSLIEGSFISEYDMGGEGDLYKAPEPIFEEQITSLDPVLDPMEADVSMISFADNQDFIPTQDLKLGNFESLQIDEHFDSVFSTETRPASELMDNRAPVLASDIQTEGSLSCSMVPISDNTMAPSFLDYLELDFGAAYGMMREFSDGDIKTLGNANISLIQWPGVASSEDRQQKLSRYRIKKSKRNFGRKIKYACRKALANSQPRIHGRFAKIGDNLPYQKANDSNKRIHMKG